MRLPGFNSAAATDFYNEYPGEDHHGRVNQIDFADAMERILYQSLFPDRVTMEGHDITQVALSPAVFREQLDYSVTTPSRIAEQQEAALQERIRTNDRQVYREILLENRKKRLLTNMTEKMNRRRYRNDRNIRTNSLPGYRERRFNQ